VQDVLHFTYEDDRPLRRASSRVARVESRHARISAP